MMKQNISLPSLLGLSNATTKANSAISFPASFDEYEYDIIEDRNAFAAKNSLEQYKLEGMSNFNFLRLLKASYV